MVGSSDLSGGARWGNDSVTSRVSQTETEVKQNMPDDQALSIGESSTDEDRFAVTGAMMGTEMQTGGSKNPFNPALGKKISKEYKNR